MAATKSARHWLTVGCGFFIVLLGMGSYYTLPVFYPIFAQQYGWTRANLGLGPTLILLTAALTSLVSGRVADRLGPRVPMIAGILLTALSLFTLSRIHSLAGFYLACVFCGLGIAGYNVMVVTMLMARWFLARRGLATGLTIAGMGLGGTVGPVTINALIAHYGWRSALLFGVGWLLCIALPIAVWGIRSLPDDVGLKPYEDGSEAAQHLADSRAGMTFGEALRGPNFWFLMVCAFCGMYASNSVLQHIVLHMRELKIVPAVASGTLSLTLFASVVGRFGLGLISDWIPRRASYLLSYGLLIGGEVLLVSAGSPQSFRIAGMLVGLGYGGTIVAMTLTAADVFGMAHLGSILSVILVTFNAGGSVGPEVTGIIADHAGYPRAFEVAVAVALAGAFCAAMGASGRREKLSEEPAVAST